MTDDSVGLRPSPDGSGQSVTPISHFIPADGMRFVACDGTACRDSKEHAKALVNKAHRFIYSTEEGESCSCGFVPPSGVFVEDRWAEHISGDAR